MGVLPLRLRPVPEPGRMDEAVLRGPAPRALQRPSVGPLARPRPVGAGRRHGDAGAHWRPLQRLLRGALWGTSRGTARGTGRGTDSGPPPSPAPRHKPRSACLWKSLVARTTPWSDLPRHGGGRDGRAAGVQPAPGASPAHPGQVRLAARGGRRCARSGRPPPTLDRVVDRGRPGPSFPGPRCRPEAGPRPCRAGQERLLLSLLLQVATACCYCRLLLGVAS